MFNMLNLYNNSLPPKHNYKKTYIEIKAQNDQKSHTRNSINYQIENVIQSTVYLQSYSEPIVMLMFWPTMSV